MKYWYPVFGAFAGSTMYLIIKDLKKTTWDRYYIIEKRTFQSYVNPGLIYGFLFGIWKCRLDKTITNYYRKTD